MLYKILAKVLADRLKIILPNLISENQSAFVSGRSITDNVLVAIEVIHHMKRKIQGCEGEIVLESDISKEYDKVDWSFLKARMYAMGFCKKWVNWIMMCVTTVSYEFCFSGSSVGPVIPSRGLRQGDPCVEGLSNSLDKTEAEGVIYDSQISSSAPCHYSSFIC